MLLSRTQILEALDRQFEVVPVPEWNGEVRVGSFTGLDRAQFEQRVYVDGKTVDMSAYKLQLVVACAVDEDGKTMFTAEDVAALGAKSAVALDRVFAAAARINGLLPSNAKAIEGNSDAGQAGSDTSDSLTASDTSTPT